MSIIAELGKDYEHLPTILDLYAADLKLAKTQIAITGKLLEVANSENSAFLHFYDQRKVELNSLVKFFKLEVDRIKGGLFKSYKENYSRALTERDINKYIDNEPPYIKINSLLIEVEEMHEQYQSVVTAFTTRNYALSNITKIRVASLEYTEI